MLFDGTYLDLIINNLLSNAFKYTEEGERIYVNSTEKIKCCFAGSRYGSGHTKG